MIRRLHQSGAVCIAALNVIVFTTVLRAAATTVVNEAELTGFDGITVGTETCNVRFIYDDCYSISGDAAGLDFKNNPDASAATTALLNVFDLSPVYDDDPSRTIGVSGNSRGVSYSGP